MHNNYEAIPIPPEYICSITLSMMDDPVIAADGCSYERAAITQWLTSGHRNSPRTGAMLAYTTLTPNIDLRNLIQEFKSQLPLIQKEQQIRTDLDVAIKLREEMLEEQQTKKPPVLSSTRQTGLEEQLETKEREARELKAEMAKIKQQMTEMQESLKKNVVFQSAFFVAPPNPKPALLPPAPVAQPQGPAGVSLILQIILVMHNPKLPPKVYWNCWSIMNQQGDRAKVDGAWLLLSRVNQLLQNPYYNENSKLSQLNAHLVFADASAVGIAKNPYKAKSEQKAESERKAFRDAVGNSTLGALRNVLENMCQNKPLSSMSQRQ